MKIMFLTDTQLFCVNNVLGKVKILRTRSLLSSFNKLKHKTTNFKCHTFTML